MGTNESKLAEKLPKDEPSNEKDSIPSTPILTPKMGKILDKSKLDPRSPSRNISRTPIQLMTAVSEKLEALDLTETPQTPIRTKILDTDPRSPAFEFTRTPIVVSGTPDQKLPDKIRNKNLDKVRGIAVPSSPFTKSPKLLASTAVTPKTKMLDPCKRKSMVLLETNIDFTETDLDAVIKEKYSGKKDDTTKPEEDLFDQISDPRSPTVNFTRTPVQVPKIMSESDNDITLNTPKVQKDGKTLPKENLFCAVEDPRSPTVEFTRTPIQVTKVKVETVNIEIDTQNSQEEKQALFKLEEAKQDNVDNNEKYVENLLDLQEVKPEPEELLHKSVFGVKFEDSVSFVCLSPNTKKVLENNNVMPKAETDQDDETPEVKDFIDNKEATKTDKPQDDLTLNEDVSKASSIDPNIMLPTSTILEEKLQKTAKPHTVTTQDLLDICDKVIEDSPEQTKSKLALSPIPKVKSDLFVQQTLSSLNTKVITPKKCQSEPATPPVIDLTADVKELDKKLTNLIYEDKDLVVCPRIVKIKEQSRTPLGLRSSLDNINNQKLKKQKLKVSDKPRKSEFAVSKIPVFKEKKVKKGEVQCENTPPRSMARRSEMRPKKSKWDVKDDTLVI